MDTQPDRLRRDLLLLQKDLDRLSAGDEDALPKLRAHLRRLVGGVWMGLARRDYEAPQRAAEALSQLRDGLESSAAPGDPGATAAGELDIILEMLRVGANAASLVAAEEVLKNPALSRLEQQLLIVLREHKDRFLRRGEVHELWEQRFGPEFTPQHIGQRLEKLHSMGLLLRTQRTAQGNARAAFYALSDRGEELATGVEAAEVWDPWKLPPPERSSIADTKNIDALCAEFRTPLLPLQTASRAQEAFQEVLKASPAVVYYRQRWTTTSRRETQPGSVLIVDLNPDCPVLTEGRSSLFGIANQWEKLPVADRHAWLQTQIVPSSAGLLHMKEQNDHRLSYLPATDNLNPALSLREAVAPSARRLCFGARSASGSFISELRQILSTRWHKVFIQAPPAPYDALLYLATVLLPHHLHRERPSSHNFIQSILRARGSASRDANTENATGTMVQKKADIDCIFRAAAALSAPVVQPPGRSYFEGAAAEPSGVPLNR